jgi:hypothetical protein
MRLLLKAGFANIDDLGDMLLKNVSHICTTISKLSNARGGVRVGCALVRSLQAQGFCLVGEGPPVS